MMRKNIKRLIGSIVVVILISSVQAVRANLTPFIPNDPLFLQQSQLLDHESALFAPTAWAMYPERGAGVTIAILSTGVDLKHPDLQGNLVPGYDFVDDDSDPSDTNPGALSGHGTALAGIAAARGNNGIGISGVAPNAKIMPIRVMDKAGNAEISDVANGIIYAVDHGANVIDVSIYGSTYNFTLDAAIQYAEARGVIVVAPVGDNNVDFTFNGDDAYPARFPSVTSVGATGNPGDPNLLHRWHESSSYGSNYVTGPGAGKIDVFAPGYNILSTCLVGGAAYSASPCIAGVPATSGSYTVLSGTSPAAAFVAGAAALVISAKVVATPAEVREALTCGTVPLENFGSDIGFPYSAGELELDYALNWHDNSSKCKIPLTNDVIRSAISIDQIPFKSVQGVDTRTATTTHSDPSSTCATFGVQQSLWYKFQPPANGYYQFATFGSSYNTAITIYKGDPGALLQVNCNDDFGTIALSDLTVDLIAGQTYYIMVSTKDAIVNSSQVLNFTVTAAILDTTKIENDDPRLAYSGTWESVSNDRQSGSMSQTTDNSAVVAFSIRSSNIIIGRTTGPGMGKMEVWVDGNPAALSPADNYTATTTYQNPFLVFATYQPLALRQVVLIRDSTVSLGLPIDLDWIQGISNEPSTMTAITDQVDDTDPRFTYWPFLCAIPSPCTPDGWQQTTSVGSEAYKETLITAIDPAAHVDFRFTGTTVVVYRSTGPDYGDMDVRVDGLLYAKVDNRADTTHLSVPYVIGNLSNSDHIVSLSPSEPNNKLTFDASMVVSPADLKIGVKTNEDSPNLVYSGIWTARNEPSELGAFKNTSMQTTDGNAAVQFTFTGTQLVVGYGSQDKNAGKLEIYIDGVKNLSVDTTDTSATTRYTHSEPCLPRNGCNEVSTSVLTFAKHSALIKNNNGGDPARGIILDYVEAFNYPTIKAEDGIVPESSSAFIYSSVGGRQWIPSYTYLDARFNGGTATKTDSDGATVEFYFIGSGFLLYGDQGRSVATQDRGYWEVFIDNGAVSVNPFDTFIFTEDRPHPGHRPLILGVVSGSTGPITMSIGPGIHYVKLKAHVAVGTSVTFDAIQVLP